MIRELDVVVLTVDRPEHGLSAGHSGAVVESFGNDRYLVDFSSADGEFFEIVFATGSELLKLLPTPEGQKAAA